MTHVLSETFLEAPVVADDDPSPLTSSFRLPRVFFRFKGTVLADCGGSKVLEGVEYALSKSADLSHLERMVWSSIDEERFTSVDGCRSLLSRS